MKTSVIEVQDMLSVLTVDDVEARFGGVPGVDSATVNHAEGNVTVRYDETRLEVADIKVMVHQRGPQAASESQPVAQSGHEPARKPDATPTPTPKETQASVSKPEAAMPKTPAVAAAPMPPVSVPAGDRQQDKAAPIAQPSTPSSATPAASPRPSPVAPAAKPSTPAVAAPKGAADAKSPTPAAAAAAATSAAAAGIEPDSGAWKVHALSLAVTLSVAYALCVVVDLLFPRFGLLAALAPASPLPISGGPLAYLTGFALFTVAGLVFGAVHGVAWDFWNKRLR